MHPGSSCYRKDGRTSEGQSLPLKGASLPPRHSWTRYPEQQPHKDHHIRLEDSLTQRTRPAALFSPSSKGKETNRKETPTQKHDLTSGPRRTQRFFPHLQQVRP